MKVILNCGHLGYNISGRRKRCTACQEQHHKEQVRAWQEKYKPEPKRRKHEIVRED